MMWRNGTFRKLVRDVVIFKHGWQLPFRHMDPVDDDRLSESAISGSFINLQGVDETPPDLRAGPALQLHRPQHGYPTTINVHSPHSTPNAARISAGSPVPPPSTVSFRRRYDGQSILVAWRSSLRGKKIPHRGSNGRRHPGARTWG